MPILFLSILIATMSIVAEPAKAEQKIEVMVSWNTWETNLDEKGESGNLTCIGYYSEKEYFEGADEAPHSAPYDVAADLDIFPLGTIMHVGAGIGWVKVVDVCGACKGRLMIDVWCGKNEYMHRRDNITAPAIVVRRGNNDAPYPQLSGN
ncbi:MAG: hypothetical protein OEV28_00275 [Nitrospirota bacterium]|nr:hypothetical protein [Nitrospirota bacterium]